MRACYDHFGGEGQIVDVTDFCEREGLPFAQRVEVGDTLRAGNTYVAPEGRWSLTPVPGRRW